MPFSSLTTEDREYAKFRETSSSEVAVAVLSESIGSFEAPSLTDAIAITYPTATTEVYTFRQGGVSGTILMTITLTYTTASKQFLSSAVKT